MPAQPASAAKAGIETKIRSESSWPQSGRIPIGLKFLVRLRVPAGFDAGGVAPVGFLRLVLDLDLREVERDLVDGDVFRRTRLVRGDQKV
jgi:hypothetical protein